MYIGFQRGGGIFDTLIKWWTCGPYSHTELIFSSGVRHSSIPGIGTCWLPAIIMDDGVPVPRAGWHVLPIEADEERVRAWCNDHIHDWYDWPGIFLSQIFPMKSQASTRYWCTEANIEALQYGYCQQLRGVDSRLMNPNRLYHLLTS